MSVTQVIVTVFVRSDKTDTITLYPNSINPESVNRHVKRVITSFYGSNIRYEIGKITIEDGVL